MNRTCPNCEKPGIPAIKLFFWPVQCRHCGSRISVSHGQGILILSIEVIFFLFCAVLFSMYFGIAGGVTVTVLWALIDLVRRKLTPLEIYTQPIDPRVVAYLIILSVGLVVLYFVASVWIVPESTFLILFLAGFFYPISAIFMLAIILMYYFAIKDKGIALIATISLIYIILWLFLSIIGVSDFEQFLRSMFIYLSLAYGLGCVVISSTTLWSIKHANLMHHTHRWGVFSHALAYVCFAVTAFVVARFISKAGSYGTSQDDLLAYYHITIRWASILGISGIVLSLFLKDKPLLLLSGLTFSVAAIQSLVEMGAISNRYAQYFSFIYVIAVLLITLSFLIWKWWIYRKDGIKN